MDHPRLDFGHTKYNFNFLNALSRSGVCKPPTRWTPCEKPSGVKLASHLHLMPMLRLVELRILSSYMRLWRGLRQKALTSSRGAEGRLVTDWVIP
jgi:hypothetical protein